MTAVRTQCATLVLHGGHVAVISDLDGIIRAEEQHGFFAGDTRVISTYISAVNGCAWQLLASTHPGHGTARWEFQNREMRDELGHIDAGVLRLSLRRRVQGALHDDFVVQSFARRPVWMRLTLQIDADFADLFEVKAGMVAPRINARRSERPDGFSLAYERRGFRRGIDVRLGECRDKPRFSGSRIIFDARLEPAAQWSVCLDACPDIDGRLLAFGGDPHAEEPDPVARTPRVEVQSLRLFDDAFECGYSDLHALALPQADAPPHLAGGAPWFLALFGRDSLLASLMSGIDGSAFSEGALAALAKHQGTRRDDWRDEEPGKILHELRDDELTRCGELPYSPYFGTHDAASLYCLTLWNAWRWSGKRALLDAHLDIALKALRWCDALGDRDDDGFQEYETRSPKGYRHQGWKDAHDAVVRADGSEPELPIATVELQGYLFAARLAMAEILGELGRDEEAARLRRGASELRALVEERFWLDRPAFYAFALDGRKQCVDAVASNPAHLLWCGLPGTERARQVAARLLAPDMFSGWGLRTLSSDNPAYNPLSYQLGSVWPHDTAIAAAGLWRYGFRDDASHLMRGLLEAGARFEDARFPELFCGFDDRCGFPVPYHQANIPQAWAAAVPLLFAQLFLGLVPDAPRGRCFVDPWLPEWLPRFSVRGIAVGEGSIDVSLRRENGTVIDRLDGNGIEVTRGSCEAPLWGKPPTETPRGWNLS